MSRRSVRVEAWGVGVGVGVGVGAGARCGAAEGGGPRGMSAVRARGRVSPVAAR